MDRKHLLRRNIPLLHAWNAIHWALLFMPVVIPFLTGRGLSLTEIFTLQAIFSVVILLMEVPSGYFADVMGRKQSLFIGSVFGTFALILYTTAQSFWAFAFMEVLFGIGSAFNSGSREALLYDSLHELGETERYVRENGRYHMFGRFSEALSAPVGGLLATIALVVPFLVGAVLFALSIPLVLFMVEPVREKRVGKHLAHLWEIFLDTLHRVPALKWILILGLTISTATRIGAWLLQPLWGSVGIDIGWYGLLWGASLGLAGIVSWQAHRIDSAWGRHVGLGLLVLLAAAGFLGGGLLPGFGAVAAALLIHASFGLNFPLVHDEVNSMVAGSRRATVFSLQSLIANALFALAIPAVGALAERSVSSAFVTMGVATLLVGLPLLALSLRHHDRKHLQ